MEAFLVYLLNFGSILGLYFISLFDVNLAFCLFLIYVGLSIFADLTLTQKCIDNDKLIKSQKQALEEASHNYNISAIVGSKLLEKYVEKTGDEGIMERVVKEVEDGFKNANKAEV